MSYTFTITCNTLEEIDRLIAAVRHTADPTVAAQVETAAAADGAPPPTSGDPLETPKRRGRPPRATATEPAAPATTDVAEPKGQTTEVQEAQGTPAQQPTLDDARAALRGLQARIGEDDMAKPIALLKDFGATRISEVKAEDYAAFIATCAKAG